jgi:Tol biopolymer transport system component
LAFSNYEDIFLLNLASGAIENLTANIEGDFRFPKWSPDGKSILIRNGIPIVRPNDCAPTATGNFKIFSLPQKSFQDVEMFDLFASPSYTEWPPAGKMVVYKQYQGIFIFDVNTEQLRRITTEEVVATNPKFSTDGGMISYFRSDLSDNGNNWQNFLTLYDITKESNEIINNIYSYDES